MGSKNRNTESPLKQLLAVAPRMRFWELVSLLERRLGTVVGADIPPDKERIRFRHDPSLSFSSGDVSSARLINDRVEITTTFLGLTGSGGPLPLYLAEEIEQEDTEAPTQRDFLDIFHHRLVSLLFRVVMRYRPALTHASDDQDLWSLRMLSLMAIQFGTVGAFPDLPRGRLLRLLPVLARRGRGAESLELALGVMLEGVIDDSNVDIKELAGSRSRVDRKRLVRLGVANHRLGHFMLGETAPDPGGRFCVRIGPLTSAGRDQFEAGGDGLTIVRETIRLVLRAPLSYDIQLRLKAEAVLPMMLGIRGVLGRDSRLGGAIGQEQTVLLRDVGERSR